MKTKLVAERLGTTIRHSARLAKLVGVPLKGCNLIWEENHIQKAKFILLNRLNGKGRFTKSQER